MKFGIWTPRGGRSEFDGHEDGFKNSVRVVQAAERAGFDITLIAQRFLGPDLEAFVTASALAPVTSTIELMVAIHPGMLTPQVIAKMGATLDRISGGRFCVNLVNGWWQEEIDFFSNGTGWLDSTDDRYFRMGEYLEVVQGLWAREEFTFHGRFFDFEAGKMPTRPIRFPPIYAASRSEIGKDVIARLCHHWFVYYEPGWRNFERSFEGIVRDVTDMNRRAARHGRKLTYGVSANCVLGATQKEAEERADAIEATRTTEMKSGGVSIIALGAGLVGTPDRIVELLRRYEEIGVECAMIRFPDTMEGIEIFEREVIPKYRRLTGKTLAPAMANA